MPTKIKKSRRSSSRIRLFIIAVVILSMAGFVGYSVYKGSNSRASTGQVRNPLGTGVGPGFIYRSDADFNRTLNALHDVGCKWVRQGLRWHQIEKSPGVYDWGPIDRMAAATKQRNMNWLMNLSISVPGWSNGNQSTRHIPKDPTAYANYVKAVALHLPNQIYFEISNEPNTDDNWEPAPNPAEYTNYLKAAYKAIKSVRPKAVILSGGIGANEAGPNRPLNIPGSDFLSGMYAAGAKPYFDVVSFHPYWWPPDHQPHGYGELLKTIDVMKMNGDSQKPIWATEYGPPSERAAKNLQLGADGQAKLLREQYNQLAALPQMRNIFWYDYIDNSLTELNSRNTRGLVRADYTPKPAFHTFAAITKSQKSQSGPSVAKSSTPHSTTSPTSSSPNATPAASITTSQNASTQTSPTASSTTKTPEKITDVPKAAANALINPTEIPSTLRGSYGWLVGIFGIVVLGVVGLGGWELARLIQKHRTLAAEFLSGIHR